MYRTFEAVFRHPLQLLLLLVIPLAIGLGIAELTPRTYQSSASLWALRRYEIIGATGPETNLLATPSETQVAALTELLQSRTFALSVAKSTDLASTLNLGSAASSPQLLDDALLLEVSQHVQVTSLGYNLFEISYSNHNPRVSQEIVAAVIQMFREQSEGLSVVEGQRLLEGYQTQLVQAKKDADTAAQTEAQYLAAHPELSKAGNSPLNDPQYALLDSKRLQAQATLQNIQSSIASISQQIALQNGTGDTFFRVIDTPVVPDASLSRTKTIITAGGVGAAVGLMACIVYILVLVRRDRAIYTTRDLTKVLDYPILLSVPQLTASARDSLTHDVA